VKNQETIFLVDDERELRGLVAELLEREGYNVRTAGCVVEAKKVLKNSGFDLLLLDVMLPDGSGLDLLRYMREEGIQTPVIMLTGTSGLDVAVESVRLGAREFVTKPVRIPHLLHSVRDILSKESHEPAGQ